jgi:hypothetical protein
MTKQHEGQSEPYYTQDRAIGEFRYSNEAHGLRLKLHRSDERIVAHDEVVPLKVRTGTRTYFLAKPCLLLPQYYFNMATYPYPREDGAIGEVTSVDQRGTHHQEIGNAQAWYYPGDQQLVLWECYLDDRFRQDKPAEDPNLKTLWHGFERVLLDQLPKPERIVTTWEDIYAREDWQAFMQQQGYTPATPATFTRVPR